MGARKLRIELLSLLGALSIFLVSYASAQDYEQISNACKADMEDARFANLHGLVELYGHNKGSWDQFIRITRKPTAGERATLALLVDAKRKCFARYTQTPMWLKRSSEQMNLLGDLIAGKLSYGEYAARLLVFRYEYVSHALEEALKRETDLIVAENTKKTTRTQLTLNCNVLSPDSLRGFDYIFVIDFVANTIQSNRMGQPGEIRISPTVITFTIDGKNEQMNFMINRLSGRMTATMTGFSLVADCAQASATKF